MTVNMRSQMNYSPHQHLQSINRRTFLTNSAYGLGAAALSTLLTKSGLAASAASSSASPNPWRGIINPPHFPIKAKRIIHLCMAGGPSHLETFDFKSKLKELDG